MRLTKAWTAIHRLLVISKSELTDKIKGSFFQAAVVSILLYRCTTWTLTKRMEKRLDGNYTRMLRVIWNKSWRHNPTKQQLYGYQPPITKTISVRWTRHARHCWRSKLKLISDILLWTPSHGRVKAGRPAKTYIQLLCGDTVCSLEELPWAMDDRDWWREGGLDPCTPCFCSWHISNKIDGSVITRFSCSFLDSVQIESLYCSRVKILSETASFWYKKK